MSVTHPVTRNPTKHNETFKAAVFWYPLLHFFSFSFIFSFFFFLNLYFLYLGKRFLFFP